jgi:tetratricopeptide (TPR) repeat protein
LYLLLAPFSLLHAQTSDELFQKGNELYRQGKFVDAIKQFEKVLGNNEENGELYFNLGNAYFKSNDYAHAILNYERAKKFLPTDEAVNVNLQLANVHVTDNVEPIPLPFYVEWWNVVKSWFSLNQLSSMLVGFFIALLISVAMFLYTRSFFIKRLFLIFNAAFLGCVVLVATIFIIRVSEGTSQQFAVVLTDVVNVKTTPDDNSSDAFVIHQGLKVRLLDKVGDWREVKLADGKVGWMKEKEFEEI